MVYNICGVTPIRFCIDQSIYSKIKNEGWGRSEQKEAPHSKKKLTACARPNGEVSYLVEGLCLDSSFITL